MISSAIINENEPIVPAGRSFDTMGSKATVINAKSTMDWVDMKGKPLTKQSEEKSSSSIAERRRKRRGGFGDK